MLAPIRLVLFDLDGTLIDSAPDLCKALAHAFAEVGLPPHDVNAVRRMIGEGQRVLIERALVGVGADLNLLDDVLARFRRYYDQHLVEKTVLYDGVRETLAALSPRLPLGIATNKPGAWARRIIEAFALSAHFRWVLGEDDVGARKPDPRLLLTLCARAEVKPDETLMVGDSAIDRAAAMNAGVQLALCTYGFGDEATMQDARARPSNAVLGSATRPYLLGRLPELLAVLGD